MRFVKEDFSKANIAKIVRRRHPYYTGLLDHWRFLNDCYKGGPEWFKDNVFRYMKEGDVEYSDRVKRAYRFNHTREVVDLVNKYLYRQKPKRNERDAPEQLKQFWKNSTINGLSIDEFSKTVSTKSSIYGRIYVVIDSTVTEDIVSLKDAEKANAQIYAYVVTPDNVLDLSYDNRGVLNWVLIREVVRDDDSPLTSSGNMIVRYRLWTRNQWFVFKSASQKSLEDKPEINAVVATTSQPVLRDSTQSLELVSNGDHNMGEVPVVVCNNLVSDELYNSTSLVGDIAYLDRACANYASNLDAIIQDQTFSQLAMPAQGLMPGDDEYQKLLEIGTKRIFIYDGETNSAPFFLSPDPRQAQLISSAINQIIGEIYHSVGLGVERSKDVSTHAADKASGVAKSIDFERVSALLTSKADSMQFIENRISRIASKWAGIDIEDAELVSYPDTFDVRELYDEFYIATQMAVIDMPAGIRGEQMKAVVEKIFPQMSKDLREKMRKEITKWSTQEEQLSEQEFINGMMNEATATMQTQNGESMENKPSQDSEQAADTAQDDKLSEPTNETVVIIKELPVSEEPMPDEAESSTEFEGKGHDRADGMSHSSKESSIEILPETTAQTVFRRQQKTIMTRKVISENLGTKPSSSANSSKEQAQAESEAARNREASGRVQSIAKSKKRNNRTSQND